MTPKRHGESTSLRGPGGRTDHDGAAASSDDRNARVNFRISLLAEANLSVDCCPRNGLPVADSGGTTHFEVHLRVAKSSHLFCFCFGHIRYTVVIDGLDFGAGLAQAAGRDATRRSDLPR
jgi:hypothetical protein